MTTETRNEAAERLRLVDEIAGALAFVIEERKPKYLSDTVQDLVSTGEFAKAATYIQTAVLAYLLPMIVDGVPHGPNGECPTPELCSALIEHDIEALAAERRPFVEALQAMVDTWPALGPWSQTATEAGVALRSAIALLREEAAR